MLNWALGASAGALLGFAVFGDALPVVAFACLAGFATSAATQPRDGRKKRNEGGTCDAPSSGSDGTCDSSGDCGGGDGGGD